MPASKHPLPRLLIVALPLLLACQTVTSMFMADVQSADDLHLDPLPTRETGAQPTSVPADPGTESSASTHRYTQFNDNYLGDPNAPLQLTEFGDFHCPFCRQFYEDHFDDLLRDYIDTGLVYFSYRSAGEFLDGAGRVAEAAYCAEDQAAFWPYHDHIFERIVALGGELDDDELRLLASELNLDTAQFDRCLADNTYADRVELDGLHFAESGATGTPSFLINGQLAVSGVNYVGLEAALQEALGSSAALPLALHTLPH